MTAIGSMALRSGLAKWSTAWKLAAGITAGSATYAVCEDIKGPSFDPEALERGAKALREINASPYAKKVESDHFSICYPETGPSTCSNRFRSNLRIFLLYCEVLYQRHQSN